MQETLKVSYVICLGFTCFKFGIPTFVKSNTTAYFKCTYAHPVHQINIAILWSMAIITALHITVTVRFSASNLLLYAP